MSTENPIVASAPAGEILPAGVHKSRWGYHPVDYATFLRLKDYHKLMLRAYRQHRAWLAAWGRKTVRKAAVEPDKGPYHALAAQLGGERTDGALYRIALSEYRNARMPVADWLDIKSLFHRDWAAQLEKLRAHYAAADARAKADASADPA